MKGLLYLKYTALFFHLLGLAVWMGCFIAMIVCVIMLRSDRLDPNTKQTLNLFQRRLTITGNLGALAMLTSGFALFSMSDHHSLWVDLMAVIGGGLCVFSIVVITFESVIVSWRLKADAANGARGGIIGLFYGCSWAVMIGVIVVLAIVSYRV